MSKPIRSCPFVLAAALLLAVASDGRAQTPEPHAPGDVVVHGHWAIDVRQPDGALVSHTEFENGLTFSFFGTTGDSALAAILGRRFTIGEWRIELWGLSNLGPCARDENNAAPCYIEEPSSLNPGGILIGGNPNAYIFKNLQVNVPVMGGGPNPNNAAGTIELSGVATAGSTNPIMRVQTSVFGCASTVTPAACGTNAAPVTFGWSFTTASMQTPITATPGQLIQVKVTFSFS